MKMKTNINALCLLIIALCYINNTEAATCSPFTGPSGARQCTKISGYTDYQWVTCRTDSYLRSTSGGRHHCTNPFHTYCLYQCMLEKFERENGDVNGICRCTPSPPVPTSSPGETGQCYAYFGPNGARQCIKISGYSDYQWATCRTDEYLRSTSGGTHHCSHPLDIYCLYQCMLEKYDKTSGDVNSNCRCTPTSPVPTSSPSSPVSTSFRSLPASSNSPSPPVSTSSRSPPASTSSRSPPASTSSRSPPVSTSSRSPQFPASTSSPLQETDQCHPNRGPNGARQCIKISGYSDYQWATCRTDSYLKSTSGGRHHCRNPLHTYCLYQCMVEKYGQSSGDVSSNCRCTPGENSASQKEKYTLVFVVFVAISCLLVS